MNVMDAAIHAGQRRIAPDIPYFSAAAVGVIPMIVSRSSLWGPLGTVICFGLLFSMVLTLFVLPVLYWLFFKKEDEVTNTEKNSQPANKLKKYIKMTKKNILFIAVWALSSISASAQQHIYSLQHSKELALQNNFAIKNSELNLSSSKKTNYQLSQRIYPV